MPLWTSFVGVVCALCVHLCTYYLYAAVSTELLTYGFTDFLINWHIWLSCHEIRPNAWETNVRTSAGFDFVIV